jgi:sulfide:quinone oxidoreductase
MKLTWLTPDVAVSGQIRPEDLAELKTLGIASVVNNRPDNEEPGQPTSDGLGAEASRLGLGYSHVPVVPGEVSDRVAIQFAEALRAMKHPVLAFCRSGNRSAIVWKRARALAGGDREC